MSTQRYGINDDWRFLRGRADRGWIRAADDRRGEIVSLPHCWNQRDTFQQSLRYYQGHGCYRRSFRLPQTPNADGRWHLVTEGFYGLASVYLDGKRIAVTDGQYLGMDIDLTACVSEGASHVLALRLDNRYHRHVLPGKDMPDFLLYGGLAGHCFLESRPELHIEPHSLRATCANPMADKPTIDFRLSVLNSGTRNRSVSAHCRISTGDCTASAAADAVMCPPGGSATVHGAVVLDSVLRWSLEDPNLYHVRVEVVEAGSVLDRDEIRVGIRQAEFRQGCGFFLNDRHVFLHGVNRHESIPGLGNALPPELHRHDAEVIKAAGLNCVRLSHYPQHPAFLDACDELGILVYPEIATWKSVRTGRWLRAACRQMRAMVRRDTHHPSVILWGIGNESRSRKAFEALIRTIREVDVVRPTIYAENHIHRGIRAGTLATPDVLGVNYELDKLEQASRLSRNAVILVSECTNRPHTKRGDLEAEREQLEAIHDDIAVLRAKPFVAGYLLWSFNDYATQRKARYRRRCGIVDAWRLPKMAVAYLQGLTASGPFVRIFAAVKDTQTHRAEVYVIANGERTVLTQNATRLDAWEGCPVKVVTLSNWSGELRARTVKEGQSAEDSLAPFGPAVKLAATPAAPAFTTSSTCMPADITVRDSEDRLVRSWSGDITIQLEGPCGGSFFRNEDSIPISHGTGRCFLRYYGSGEPITLRAGCPGLNPVAVEITAAETGECEDQSVAGLSPSF